MKDFTFYFMLQLENYNLLSITTTHLNDTYTTKTFTRWRVCEDGNSREQVFRQMVSITRLTITTSNFYEDI